MPRRRRTQSAPITLRLSAEHGTALANLARIYGRSQPRVLREFLTDLLDRDPTMLRDWAALRYGRGYLDPMPTAPGFYAAQPITAVSPPGYETVTTTETVEYDLGSEMAARRGFPLPPPHLRSCVCGFTLLPEGSHRVHINGVSHGHDSPCYDIEDDRELAACQCQGTIHAEHERVDPEPAGTVRHRWYPEPRVQTWEGNARLVVGDDMQGHYRSEGAVGLAATSEGPTSRRVWFDAQPFDARSMRVTQLDAEGIPIGSTVETVMDENDPPEFIGRRSGPHEQMRVESRMEARYRALQRGIADCVVRRGVEITDELIAAIDAMLDVVLVGSRRTLEHDPLAHLPDPETTAQLIVSASVRRIAGPDAADQAMSHDEAVGHLTRALNLPRPEVEAMLDNVAEGFDVPDPNPAVRGDLGRLFADAVAARNF